MAEGGEQPLQAHHPLVVGEFGERLGVGVRVERGVGVLEAAKFAEIDGVKMETDGPGEAAEPRLIVFGENLPGTRPRFPAQVLDEVRAQLGVRFPGEG